MTTKQKTGHIMTVITPDIKASLSEPLMNSVVLGMPVTTQHDRNPRNLRETLTSKNGN
jgi:hypothetical protein